MFKVSYSASTIDSFGEINFADSLTGNASVYKTIDQMLGNRDVKAQYTYSDLFRSYFLLTLCGGECAEDITEYLRRELIRVKGFVKNNSLNPEFVLGFSATPVFLFLLAGLLVPACSLLVFC